ncbi:MAG TPA: nucleoside deaminase [Thermoanaerobaculia bacterium]|jgi:tRNA(Arg) A34 adenosine deaminase TadA|nr:nucleoside deaminase [Thermoanaerobaculia bacterium]
MIGKPDAHSGGNPFMARAIELSLQNVEQGGGPFAALVVRDGRIVAEGTNRVTATHDPTAHAEMVAIREACRALATFQLSGCDFYTSCEPCPMCLGAIYWARPDRVYFGNTAADAAAVGFDDSEIYRELELPHGARRIPMIQLMRDEAQAAFRAWRDKADKVAY